MRLGVELPSDMTVAERIQHAKWAEEQGFEDVWMGEIGDPDALLVLAAASQHVKRVRLGTMIVPIGTRTAPTLAAAAATMSHLSDGQFVLGLGVSSEVVVERWNGVPFSRPLERARETIAVLRAIFDGQVTAHDGIQVSSSGFKLRYPPPAPPPIALAALNERMLELAGEVADGVWLNFVPLDGIPMCLAAVDRGAERAGRDKRPEILISMGTQVTDSQEGVDAARESYRRWLYFYMTVPPYQRAFEWFGFGSEVAAAREARARRDKAGVIAAIPQRLADEISAFGSADFCRKRFQDFADAGVDTMVVTPYLGDTHATLQTFARTTADVDLSGAAESQPT
jgi:probable F420-dependent oxidoreductase